MATLSGISVQQITNMMQWCRENNVLYTVSKTYPYVLRVAEELGMDTPNGVRYHIPQYGTAAQAGVVAYWQRRAFLLWRGEHRGDVAEAFAYIMMTTDRTEMILMRCKRASLAALNKEKTEADHYRMACEVDAIHELVYMKQRGLVR